ncbi:P-loop NTPase fold protein [Janthinobacterium sp. NFX145]|uniref:KAP family P-loop NTPase fold protein n=1 Tax=Janthinobacterium sp. NFX145 TaxID=3415602 RepID=UPI003CC6D5E9
MSKSMPESRLAQTARRLIWRRWRTSNRRKIKHGSLSVPDTRPANRGAAIMREQSDGNTESRSALVEEQPAMPAPGSELLALLRQAHALATMKDPPSRSITTSLMLFTLARADDLVQPSIQAPPDALFFSRALKELAGESLQATWSGYFSFQYSSISAPLASETSTDELTYSLNAEKWLSNAAVAARQAGRDSVTVGDLISALWSLREGKFMSLLHQMGIDMAQLQAAYERHPLAKVAQQSPENVLDILAHDHPSLLDYMEFAQYAIAIVAFLTSDQTRGSISISIQAPWGAGKSSLMRQIQHQLDPPRPAEPESGTFKTRDVLRFLDRKSGPDKQVFVDESKRWTVWFNAWKYESSEQVWAGLVDAIVSQVSDRLSPVERELFLLRLNLSRIDDGVVRRKIYDRVGTFWWIKVRRWLLGAMGLIISLVSVSLIPPDSLPAAIRTWFDAAAVAIPTAIGTQIAITVYAVQAFFSSRKKVADEPAKFSLAEYVRVPDYARTVGIMHQIHQDLRRVMHSLPQRRTQHGDGASVIAPLVIFIDDLDRCSPGKIASVVEGINTFLAGDQSEFLFVIGMDPQIVAAALEHAHRDIKKQLPSYEKLVPLGWRFMDKFIQLAFTIPPSRHLKNGKFIDYLIGSESQAGAAASAGSGAQQASHAGAAEAQTRARTKSEAPQDASERQRRASSQFMRDGKDVQTVLRGISKEYACGPREIKRTLNFVRFVLLLRIARISHGLPVPSLAQYQRWIVLCIRWPDMALWLQWGGSMPPHASTTPSMDDVVSRRLCCLEECSALPDNDREKWSTSAAIRLGLPSGQVSWLEDPEIYHFFSHETSLPREERLSSGAVIGFY